MDDLKGLAEYEFFENYSEPDSIADRQRSDDRAMEKDCGDRDQRICETLQPIQGDQGKQLLYLH